MRAFRVLCIGAVALASAIASACQVFFPFDEAGAGADAGATADATSDGAPGVEAGGDANGDAAADGGAPDACSADLQTDENNCGVCGHDCQGGECDAGACQPVALASGQAMPQYLEVYGGQVYWTTYDGSPSAGVWHVPADGGTPAMYASDDWLSDLTVGAQGVYWASPNRLATYADGGVIAYVGNTNPQAVTSDGMRVYWSDWGMNKPIYSLPFGMPAASPPAPLYTNSGTAFDLAVYQGTLYWTVNDNVVTDGLVQFGPTTGGQVTTIANQQANPVGISVDATGIYWATSGDLTVMGGGPEQAVSVKPMGGAAPRTLAKGLNHPVNVWADPNGPYVYWVNLGTPPGYADGSVMRMAKDGTGSAETIASAQAQPWDITGDATSIYWVAAGIADAGSTGQVMKLAK